MRITRNCPTGDLNTGISKCPIDFKHVKGAILFEGNHKLATDFSGDDLLEMCHGVGQAWKIYPLKNFVEYAKSGGEAQVNTNGYGASNFTGMSPQTDTFTLDRFYPELHAGVLKAVNYKFGVYYYTKDNVLIGINDGTDVLAPIPVTLVPNATPLPTSGAQSTETVGFAYLDTDYAHAHYDYVKVDFNIEDFLMGLVPVELQKRDANDWRLVEKIGGLDRTAEFGNALKAAGATAIPAASAVTYTNGVLGITLATGKTDSDVALADPGILYGESIEGIVQWKE